MQLPFALERPLVFFDIETTGLDLRNDRIIRVRRFNPGMPSPADATAVHGISDADVANEVTFCRTAKSLVEMFAGCDLAGFNIRRFDLQMLMHEFRRCEVEFSLEGRYVLDVQTIFHREERRDLSAAAQFYLGRAHEEAHTALGDIRTAAAVLSAQLARYPRVPRDLHGLHAYCEEFAPFRTELDRWFKGPPEARLFRRGRHRGQTLAEVARESPDYLRWMLNAEDMDEDVLEVVREALGEPRVATPAPGGAE
jgi:DNA polymerase-3 subunit epsilon